MCTVLNELFSQDTLMYCSIKGYLIWTPLQELNNLSHSKRNNLRNVSQLVLERYTK